MKEVYRYFRSLLSAHIAARNARHKLYQECWDRLTPHLKAPQQLAGVAGVACGATHSIMEKCNFSCTSCYLSDVANKTEPLQFEAVKEQLDALRHHLGAGGKVQITSGEVTLLPRDELGRIISRAKEIGLDPMVMTNGQRLLQVPDYFPALVDQYGLEKIGIHIDTTQNGRPDMTLGLRERDIDPIRNRFAQLIKDARKQTGKRLHAAQTVTVTGQNVADIPDVVRWALDNVDSFRLISFLPVAQVGRTLDKPTEDLTLENVWRKICEGAGRRLSRHAMQFGHPECNITAPLLVISFGQQRNIIEVVRENNKWDLRFFTRALRKIGPYVDFNLGPWRHALKIMRPVLVNPDLLLEFPLYTLYRLWGARSWMGSLLLHALGLHKIRVRPLLLVVHKFMSGDELETPLGKERLRACVFKVPGDGQMVSMCQVNATSLRRELNLRRVRIDK